MRFKRRMKRSTKQYIIVAIICIVVIGGAAAITSIIITGQIREEYQVLLDKANREMEANKRMVYVATKTIASGEVIQKDMVIKKTVYSSQQANHYITDKEIGKTSLVSIPVGTQILKTMVTDYNVSASSREMEYQVISVNSNITKNDTVDVRIFYPDGESYVVLSKKEIKAYTPETVSVFLWLEEDELLRMSAAIVDASLYSGAKLYVTKYIEPNIQEASVITYIPSLSTLSLIEDDPNIIKRSSQKLNKEIRKALENRLADSLATDVSAINWNVGRNNAFVANSTQSGNASETKLPANESRIQNKTEAASSTDSENKTSSRIPTPTSAPAGSSKSEAWEEENELGSESYFYYTENNSEDDQVEYGE